MTYFLPTLYISFSAGDDVDWKKDYLNSKLDKRCFPRVVISGTKELPDIKTDYTGEYDLVFFNNGRPVYKHVGPFRTEGTNYPGDFYLFYVSRSRTSKIMPNNASFPERQMATGDRS